MYQAKARYIHPLDISLATGGIFIMRIRIIIA
jgi:hypothetical protein